MILPAAGIRIPDDLARGIDAIGPAVAAPEGTQVFHHTVLIKEGMLMTDVIRRPPNDLARVIDAIGLAVRVIASIGTTEETKVFHHTVLVEEGMIVLIVSDTRQPDYLARVIDAIGLAVGSTEGTKLFHVGGIWVTIVLIEEGMRAPVAIDRIPDDLPRVVYGSGSTAAPREETKVCHHTVLIKEGMADNVLRRIAPFIVSKTTKSRIPDHMAKVIYASGFAGGRGVGGPRNGTEVYYLIVGRGSSLRFG